MRKLVWIFSLALLASCGKSGKDGNNGKDGNDGAPGQVGQEGPKGQEGPEGKTGSKGPSGSDGQDGQDGAVKPVPAPQPSPGGKEFTTSNGHVLQGGKPIKLRGLNWFGLETTKFGLHGLWTGRTLESFVDQAQSLGFNAFRIPLAPDALNPSQQGSDGYASPLDQLKRLLAYTQSKGMYVLLDLHNCAGKNASTAKPGPAMGECSFYSETQWRSDLVKIATVAKDYSNVVGLDLFNEPYGFTWSDWAGKASAAGKDVLRANGNLLVFVEGVAGLSDYGGSAFPFWGENLTEAGKIKVDLPAGKFVYSPHVYGPSVSNNPYFDAATFPNNLPGIWDVHYGYLAKQGYTLVVGEFGGRMTGKDKTVMESFVSYMNSSKIENWFFWSLNPNSGDTGGLLQDDWKTVDENKYSTLKKLMN